MCVSHRVVHQMRTCVCDTCPKDGCLRNDVNEPFVALMFQIESWQLIAGFSSQPVNMKGFSVKKKKGWRDLHPKFLICSVRLVLDHIPPHIVPRLLFTMWTVMIGVSSFQNVIDFGAYTSALLPLRHLWMRLLAVHLALSLFLRCLSSSPLVRDARLQLVQACLRILCHDVMLP